LSLFSSIEGELVLKAGDRVKYRTVPLPPKCVEKQAVEVTITVANGPHETWSPLSHSTMSAHWFILKTYAAALCFPYWKIIIIQSNPLFCGTAEHWWKKNIFLILRYNWSEL
jgi:hypothetical protein